MVVQSLGALVDATPSWTASSGYGALTLYDQYTYAYQTIYRTQPNVRTCVDFLARNIAQLGLHVFQRVSETDRRRLRDHPLAVLFARPNPFTTRYRLVESLMGDLGIFFNGYWLPIGNGGQRAVLRVPPEMVTTHGALFPRLYEVSLGREPLKLKPDEIFHFRGYNPESSVTGLSPLETLRRVLAEEQSAGDYREYFWRNAARMNGVIERPKEAPDWSDTARARFKAEFEALYSGSLNSGKTAILEEGMTWKATSFSAQESEYLAGRRLTREECARAFHIPLPMVGILDHATFSNVKEQHKQLYQDCLGPWLKMIEEEIELQVLPWLDDGTRDVYCEFNIAEKLAGSFEEQTTALQAAVGRPWMAPDEARARFNMPSMGGDAARLATPLNVLVGGQASPRDSAPKALKAIAVLAAKALGTGDQTDAVESTLPKALVEAKALDDRTTAWLGLYLPGDVAEALAIDDGEAPEALHMTVAYLGRQTEDVLAALPNMIADWALTAQPLKARISGVGRFIGTEDGSADAFYASVDAPELPAWRESLLRHLAYHGLAPDKTHGFTPHITLAYVAADAPNPDTGDSDLTLEFAFDKLSLGLGDLRSDYLLKGDAKSLPVRQLKAATTGDEGSIDPTLPATRERHVLKWAEVLAQFFGRQEAALIGRVREGAAIESVWTDGARWDSELTDDLLKLSSATALVFARWVCDQLGVELDEARMAAYLKECSRISAEELNAATRARLAAALLAEVPRDAVKALFEEARTSGAQRTAVSKVTQMANFGAHEGASQGGLAWKIWQENSGNPREAHVAMAGQKVRIGERFSNGGRWPGDPVLGAANNAHCSCSVRFSRE